MSYTKSYYIQNIYITYIKYNIVLPSGYLT